MKKILAVILTVCILLSGFAFAASAEVTGEEAAQIARADFELSYSDIAGEITVGDAVPLYENGDNLLGFAVYVSYRLDGEPVIVDFWHTPIVRYNGIVYQVSCAGAILGRKAAYDDSEISVPEGGRLYYCPYYDEYWKMAPDGTITDEYGDVITREEMDVIFLKAGLEEKAQREREELNRMIEETETVHDFFVNGKNLSLQRMFDYIMGLLRRFCAYVLNDWINFPFGWDKAAADASVDEALAEYCEQNNCTVKEVYRVDKDYFVPNRQTYFSDGAYVGDGVCGVASWEMILGGYRDMGILSKLPDDITMYREIMEIMDGITDELVPKLQRVIKAYSPFIDKVLNPVLSDVAGLYIDEDFTFESYEVLGTLDIGIAMYLQQYGYTEYARRVLSNLTIGIPVLSPMHRTLFMRDFKNTVSGWIYKKTGGKLNLPTGLGNTVADTVLRSLERGEPAIIGCWTSLLGDDDLTNHYFVAASLFKVTGELKISDGKSIPIERNLVEIYDTWDHNSVELVDFDALFNTTLSDANSLALLF